MMVPVSAITDSGSIPALCNWLFKITVVTCEKTVVQFDFKMHCIFFSGYSDYLVRGGSYWTSRENNLAS